jgi:cold shock CspA family protein
MHIDGTLAKWNDDRGFGFITPTRGGPEVFAHISAFPRDGQRPRLGERLSFEIGIGKDGKQQAKNIVSPPRQTEKPYRLSEPAFAPRFHITPLARTSGCQDTRIHGAWF